MLVTLATYLTDHAWPTWCALIIALVFFHMRSNDAAYHNGVNDGYGYAREPWNRGYWRAGEWLRKYASQRWPEVNARITLDHDGYHSHHPEHDLDHKHGDAANASEFPLESAQPPTPPTAA
jgi:hypothetical protein